jgi:hypothetical protein
MKEIETLPWLTLTSEIEWEPYAERFAQSEKVLREFVPPVPEEERQLYALQREYCEIDSVMSSISPSLSSALFPDIPKSNIDFTESGSRKVGISSEVLAKRWGIGTKIAAQTLQITTQKGVRNAVHPIQRRYRTKQLQLRYNQLGSQHGRFYSDTMFSSVKSTQGHTMGQIFVNDVGFTHFVPMKLKSEAGHALAEFIQDIGIPSSLHTDEAKELTLGTWHKV